MKKLFTAQIILYKKIISPVMGRRCIYVPSCSMYMCDAIEQYGVIRGAAKGICRLLRCNPFAKGGYDPVKLNLKGSAKWIL